MSSIVLADDYELVRESIALLLSRLPDFDVVGQCRNGLQLLEFVKRLRPNVAVVEVSMKELNGIDAAREVIRISPQTRVIALSIYADENSIRGMLESGVSGYVVKNGAVQDLVDAIRYGSRGKVYFSREIADTAKNILNGAGRHVHGAGTSDRQLTPRERVILQLVAESCSSAEIARKLGICETTVKTHRNHLMDKLEVRDVAGLTRQAIRFKLIRVD